MTAGLMSSQEALQQLINALSLGSTYALLALGLAMVFSILGLVNFAHGELVTVAAYTIYLENEHGVPFPIEVISAVVAAAIPASPPEIAKAAMITRLAEMPMSRVTAKS